MVEQAGRVAADRRIDGVVGLGKFRGAFGIDVFAAVLVGLRLAVCRAARSARYGDVLCAAAIAVIVFAVFLSAFKVVHFVFAPL